MKITLDITTTMIPPIAAPSIAMMRSILHPPFGVGEGGAEMGAGGDISVEDVGGLQSLVFDQAVMKHMDR